MKNKMVSVNEFNASLDQYAKMHFITGVLMVVFSTLVGLLIGGFISVTFFDAFSMTIMLPLSLIGALGGVRLTNPKPISFTLL